MTEDNPTEGQKHCIGFDLPTAAEAYEHFHGQLEEICDYGDMCNGHTLHTWDDGGRKLYRCRKCGGPVLVQHSEFHGDESDDYYTDYFPVDSAEEAEQLNDSMEVLPLKQIGWGRRCLCPMCREVANILHNSPCAVDDSI